MPAIVFRKYLCKLVIDNNGLVRKEIHLYLKFIRIIELNII